MIRQQVSLGRVIHVAIRASSAVFDGVEGETTWRAAIVTQINEPNADGGCDLDGAFIALILAPRVQMWESSLRAADEGQSWRWPPHVPAR